MGPMKRPAASQAGAASKKAAKTPQQRVKAGKKSLAPPPDKKPQELDPIALKCEHVAKTVLDAEGFPPQVLKMLCEALPASLSVTKEDRHRCQEKVLDMVSQVLSSAEGGLIEKINCTEAKLGQADVEKATRASALETAQATEAAASGALMNAKDARDQAFFSQEKVNESLKEALEAQKLLQQELTKTRQRRDALESLQSNVFEPLRLGSAASEEVNVLLEKLAASGKEFTFDPSLLSSLPGALSKTPETRGAFDVVVVDQVDGEIKKHIAALRETISSTEAAGGWHATNVATAEAEVKAAADKLAMTSAGVKEAQIAFRESQTAAKAALKATRSFGIEIEQATAALIEIKGRLEALREGPLAVFKELVERSSSPPAAGSVDASTDSMELSGERPGNSMIESRPASESPAVEAQAKTDL